MKRQTFPLNETQLGMFLEWNQNHSSTCYSLAWAFPLPENLDIPRFRKALTDTLENHAVFKTRFLETEDGIRLFFDENAAFPVPVHNVSDAEAEAKELALPKPFDLLNGLPVRAEILKSPSGARLLLEMHHIITDGTSQHLLYEEISARYNGAGFPAEECSFADALSREAATVGGEDYRAASEAAKTLFSGRSMTVPDVSALALPPDEVPGDGRDFHIAAATLERDGVEMFCRKHTLHANLFFLGVFARTLALFAHEKKVAFFTVNHGRRDPSVRRTQGIFIKTVPVSGEMDDALPLPDYFRTFRLHRAGVYPFTHFCRDLGIKPGWGMVFQDGTYEPSLRFGDIVSPGRELMSGGATEMPVLQVFGGEKIFRLKMTAAKGRYPRVFLAEFLRRFCMVAENMLSAAPGCALKDVPVLSQTEMQSTLALSRGETLPCDPGTTFVKMLAQRAAETPAAIAVEDEKSSLSFAALENRANRLAEEMISRGVVPGRFVARLLPRETTFPLAVLAAQKCGAGYLPLDAGYPADRIAYMLKNSGAAVLVTTRGLFSGKNPDFDGKVLFADAVEWDRSSAAVIDRATPDTPAYMIYTSGSTGKPKGVVVPNRALTALIAWFVRDCALGPGKKNLSITNFSFDASVPDLFPPLAAGGGLYIVSEEVRKSIDDIFECVRNVGATGLTASTQLGLALLHSHPELPLEYMMCGGEKMLPFPPTRVRVLNGYGPTEFTVCSSYCEVDQAVQGDIPIGRPVPNSVSLVIDPLGQPVPPGSRGELALAGPQLADGYWELPEKTAAVFTPGPCGKMYRTGDLARYNAAGELEFLGRLDFQVKLRGFRIEIGEIEHTAASFPGVAAAAAEVREIAGSSHLVLYFEGAADASVLKAHMQKSLADYMVPDFFVALPALPLTPNGKIDRKKLPVPRFDEETTVPPETENETKIFAIVAEILKTRDFGVTRDFSALGLSSLGAMLLLAKLKKQYGISLKMKELQINSTVRKLAALLPEKASATVSDDKKVRPRRAFYPMTENQRGIYADWLRDPAALQYNIPAAFKFYDVSAEKLAAAAEKVLAAHPAFHARFVEKDGRIVQARCDGEKISVPVETLVSEPDGKFFSSQLQSFAPQNDSLTRCKVFSGCGAAFLFLDVHHTVFDGFSIGVFLRELATVLDGGEPAGEAYTAFDAALDEADYLESELPEADDQWFVRYLDGVESTKIETSASGADGAPGEARRIRLKLPGNTIDAACRKFGVTASDWFLTAFTELLKRIGRDEKVLINFVTAGRADPDLQNTIGMFVKTLPVRGISDAGTFSDAVRRMHDSVTELLDRERCSFARLAEKYGIRPDVLFAFEGGIFELPGKVELLEAETSAAKAPVSVIVTPGADGYAVVLEYDASLYAGAEMQHLAEMFGKLALGAVATDVLAEIALLDENEEKSVLDLARGETLEYDEKAIFPRLFHRRASESPDAVAVTDKSGSVTYRELDEKSDVLAAELRKNGVLPGGFAGVMLPRRVSFPVAVLAVQKCGAGYVPMDADYPADRLGYMLENSGAAVLITTRELFSGKNLDFSGKVLFFEETDFTVAASPEDLSAPDTPAYMIYTSGSTGRPKGVVISQRALLHMLTWACERLKIVPGKRIVTHPSFSFDASVIDIFPALASGAELHIYDEEIRRDLAGMRAYIEKNRISGGGTMSTQIGMTLLNAYPDLPLDYLLVGGEKMLSAPATKVRLFNGYGPTEFTVCSSLEEVDPARGGDIPIGRPVPGTFSVVVDRYGQLLPAGYPGELALIGPQIAEGYWHAPEKTAAAFVGMPFAGRAAAMRHPVCRFSRMYRTGDLVRYNADGKLEYMGRLDFQVKLRGFRIEIGEIESCASAFPGVQSVAAEVRDVAGAKHLVLYYESHFPLDEAALKSDLGKKLADYMVPDYFVRMAPMPLTPNGKINRKLLPAPKNAVAAETVYVEPENETEKAVADVYGEILKIEKFGATQDFFSAGGTSLIGIRAVVALQKRGLDVQYGDLFKYQTPRALAAFLRGEKPVPGMADNGDPATPERFDYGDYDYSAIDRLLAATPRDLYENFRLHSTGDVLLTGATGFLGIHVLRTLLENTDATVYALVRAKRGSGAEKRLNTQYVYYFGEKLPARFRERLVWIEGDITDPDLGETLSPFVIGTVFNCAALVKHYVADDLMDKINVGGVENLVGWCEKNSVRLVHASTYSVGGTVRSDSAAVLDERRFYIGQESDNDYVRTKFLAERAVLAAVAAGKLRAKIVRLGNLMGRESDGEFQMNLSANAFINSLKSYKAIGAYPLEELVRPIEMSPIDRVAEAICLLARTPDEFCVFHPYNAYALDMGAVVGAMNRRGFDVDWVSAREFAVRVDALRARPERAAELQGILHYAGHLLKNRKMTPVVNNWTTTVLYRLGFRWKMADENYLANFLDMLDGLAVFN
ncbi:MAG: amino acid adenylation domain-containing protein [Victivallaceae bacterium]|nr:amino acid adenylation domain-containing protein [Victivallaceae bacterium]